jgi:hypothetical protein
LQINVGTWKLIATRGKEHTIVISKDELVTSNLDPIAKLVPVTYESKLVPTCTTTAVTWPSLAYIVNKTGCNKGPYVATYSTCLGGIIPPESDPLTFTTVINQKQQNMKDNIILGLGSTSLVRAFYIASKQ